MKLTLQSVEEFENKFTLEIEGVETHLDALNMQRAICRSAIEYVRKFNGATNIMPSLLMEMKVLLEEKDLLELEQEGDQLAKYIRTAPQELKGAEVFVTVKQFIPNEIIITNRDKRESTKRVMQFLVENGIKDDFFNILLGDKNEK